MAFLEVLESVFPVIVQYGILLFELIGVGVLMVTAMRSIHMCLQKDRQVRLQLAQGIALALEFKLGGEVLRTVIVREWSELFILGAIILLRGALTFLLHWEIKNEESKISENA